MRGRWRPGYVGRPDRCRVDGPVQPGSRSTPPHSAGLRESCRQRAPAGRLLRFVPPAEWRNDRKRRPGSAPRRDADRWPSTRSESGRPGPPRRRSRTRHTPAMLIGGVSASRWRRGGSTSLSRFLLPGPDLPRVRLLDRIRVGCLTVHRSPPSRVVFPRFFVTTNKRPMTSFMDCGGTLARDPRPGESCAQTWPSSDEVLSAQRIGRVLLVQ